MLRRAAFAALLVCAHAASAGDEEPPFQPGTSVREWKGMAYDLALPTDFDPKSTYSLLVVVSEPGGHWPMGKPEEYLIRRYAKLTPDGFITCIPKSRFHKDPGDIWSASEAEDVHGLVLHLRKALPIGEGRVHAVAAADHNGFAPMFAFGKDEVFVSVTFDRSRNAGGTVAARAKKEMGVLVANDGAMDARPLAERIVPQIREKVRSIEYRADALLPEDKYWRHWLTLMEGRFTPGTDLSFEWSVPASADELGKLRAGAKRAALVWFWSSADAASADAKALECRVFLDESVRDAAAGFACIKAEREKTPEGFVAHGLKRTPALVVFDAAGGAVATFDGSVTAPNLVAALKKAAPRDRKK